jgi:hypothetical protein
MHRLWVLDALPHRRRWLFRINSCSGCSMPLPIHVDDPLSDVCPRRYLSQINGGFSPYPRLCRRAAAHPWARGERVVAHLQLCGWWDRAQMIPFASFFCWRGRMVAQTITFCRFLCVEDISLDLIYRNLTKLVSHFLIEYFCDLWLCILQIKLIWLFLENIF